MEYVKSLKWTYDILTADPTVENWGTGFTQVGTGAAAMYIGANDAVSHPTYDNGLPVGDFGLAPLPAGPRGDQYTLAGGTPYMFSKDATKEQINAALDYITIMGRGPIVEWDGLRADAQYRVDSGIPVIYRFPTWIDPAITEADKTITDEYSNVDMRLYNGYFDLVKDPNKLRYEEPGNTQEMYRELTAVIQAVVTDKDADVAALMKTANDNYQIILDNGLNKE
jgi:ABC-type glycerol-3-phosphate transport system substrate-binding protein